MFVSNIYWGERITEVILNIGRGKLSFFGPYTPQKKEELKKT
jgi:hypothetical protein